MLVLQNKLFITVSILVILSFQSFGQSRAVITGKINDQFGSLPGARVSIEGLNRTTTSDINGVYTFEVEEGEYVLIAQFTMYTPVSKSIKVSVGETVTLDFVLETGFSIDQPVSLGSRAGPKTSFVNTSAVDIVSPNDISNASHIELSQILQYIVPSFHSTHQTISDGTDHIDPVTLRGLGPDQVLVLVNGKRRHTSSLLNVNGTVGRGSVGTDFNAIPMGAIERVEVLRGGATAQYGSDAIAGVINIVLKKQTEYIQLDNRVSLNQEGDGLIAFSTANFGLKLGENGFVNLTAEFRDRASVNRAGDYTGAVYTNDPVVDEQLIAQNNFFGQTGYEGRQVMEIGSAAAQNLGLYFNGEMSLSENTIFYFHGGRSYREGVGKGFYRFPKDENRVVLELYPNGFSPEILTDIQDDAISAGVKGSVNGWNVDFSHGIGVNSLDFTVNNSNNASLGVASGKTFYAGGFSYQQSATNLDASKSFDFWRGVNVAFGAELRVENYEIRAGEEDSYIDGGATYFNDAGVELPRSAGAQVFPGFQPENELDKFRTNTSGYIDIEANVTDKLLIRGATRYAVYNDFGGQNVWKIATAYKMNENLSFRADFSTGFRAPSLHQVFFQNISTQFVGGEIVQVGTFNNESAVVTEAFGISELKPELSQHFGTGISGKINDNFTFSLDYYNIDIEDRIVLSGRFGGADYQSILQPFGVESAQFFTNAIDSRTSGLDVNLVYKKNYAFGKFQGNLGANIARTMVDGKIKVPSTLIGQEEVLFNREEVSRIEVAQPNFKITSMASLEIDKLRMQLGNTLFGEVDYIHPSDGNPANWVVNEFNGLVESRDQTFAPKLVTDLAFSYQFTNTIRATLGGNNIFNVYPDAHVHSGNTSSGNFVYSRRVQQFGVNGANYYFKLLLRL